MFQNVDKNVGMRWGLLHNNPEKKNHLYVSRHQTPAEKKLAFDNDNAYEIPM